MNVIDTARNYSLEEEIGEWGWGSEIFCPPTPVVLVGHSYTDLCEVIFPVPCLGDSSTTFAFPLQRMSALVFWC